MDKKLFRNFAFNIIKTLSSILYPLITVPYISRVLTVSDVGMVNFVTSYADLFLIVATLGIPTFALREGVKLRNDKDRISEFLSSMFSFAFIIGIVIFFIYCLSLFLFNGFCGKQSIFLLYGIVILLNAFDVQYVFNIYEDFKYVTIRTIFIQIICLIVLFLMVKTPRDAYWYVITLLISKCGSSVVNFLYSKKYVTWKISFSQINKKYMYSIMTYFLISVASNIYLSADKVMLGFMCTSEIVGLYAAATKLIQMFRNVISTISTVCLPRAVHYYQEETMKEYRELIFSIINVILMITIPVGIGSCCIARNVIMLIFGEPYIKATVAFKILAFNCIVALINGILAYQILSPKKKEKIVCIATSAGCLINIILNAIYLPVYGQNAAATTTFVSELVTFGIMIPYCRIGVSLRRVIQAIFQYIIACVPFVAVYLFFKDCINYSVVQLFIFIAFSILSYFMVLIVTKNEIVNRIYCVIAGWIRSRKPIKEE